MKARKRMYRYFGCLLDTQARWLNKMAARGYRLTRAERLLFEFEPCAPGQYRYQVEFVADASKAGAEDYARFLEDLGYRVLFKNINLSYSIGKARWRPWAEPGGRLATNRTTFNRELLIVEKPNDGKPFELHTTFEDKAEYCRRLQRPWLFLLLASVILGGTTRSWVWGICAAAALVVVIVYQIERARLGKLARTEEW